MRRFAKIDANHKAVTAAFRALGCSVVSLASVGKGCPDIAVGVAGRNLLVEIKSSSKISHRVGAKILTPDQIAFKENWRGSIIYVDDEKDVPMIVNAMRKNL